MLALTSVEFKATPSIRGRSLQFLKKESFAHYVFVSTVYLRNHGFRKYSNSMILTFLKVIMTEKRYGCFYSLRYLCFEKILCLICRQITTILYCTRVNTALIQYLKTNRVTLITIHECMESFRFNNMNYLSDTFLLKRLFKQTPSGHENDRNLKRKRLFFPKYLPINSIYAFHNIK